VAVVRYALILITPLPGAGEVDVSEHRISGDEPVAKLAALEDPWPAGWTEVPRI
jgi:hypothetical protein